MLHKSAVGSLWFSSTELAFPPLFLLHFRNYKKSLKWKLIDSDSVIVISHAIKVLLQVGQFMLIDFHAFPAGSLDFRETISGKNVYKVFAGINTARFNQN